MVFIYYPAARDTGDLLEPEAQEDDTTRMADAPDTTVSILIATYRRARALAATLDSIAGGRFPLERLQVVVADNADDNATAQVCGEDRGGLRVSRVVETATGKNAALNTALAHATGDLFFFSDDDVEFDRDAIRELVEAVVRWPQHRVFGGRVLARWPAGCPDHLAASRYLGVCFTVLDPDLPEGPHEGFRPFGPSMVVRRDVFDAGMRFDAAIGPRPGSYVMGSETDLMRRLEQQGERAVFVPAARIVHEVRAEQLSLTWAFRRVTRYGRSLAYQGAPDPGPSLFGAPRWLWGDSLRKAASAVWLGLTDTRTEAFDRALDLAANIGAIAQHRSSGNRRPNRAA